jgi:signal transduction histidine kinase
MVRDPHEHAAPESEETRPFGNDPQNSVLLQTVLDSLTHPLYVIDVANHHVRLANRTAQEMCQNGAATCYALTHRRDKPCDTEDHPCPIETIRKTGQPTVVEHVHYDAAGVARNVEVHAFPIFDGAHQLVQIIEYCVDITERKRVEEALRDLTATLETKVAQRTAELEHRARQLQRLTLELSETEDRERQHLAEVLHDDLQQTLAAAKFHVDLLKAQTKQDPSQQAATEQIRQLLIEAIGTSRSLSHELSPGVLQSGDFGDTLRWLADQVQAKHGLMVHIQATGTIDLRSNVLRAFLYKAALETLFNVVKHAGVKEARLRVRRLGRYVALSVSDRGRGFDPRDLKATSGFGLLSIRERVELLGGRMRIHSAKGHGSAFSIVVPDPPIEKQPGEVV